MMYDNAPDSILREFTKEIILAMLMFLAYILIHLMMDKLNIYLLLQHQVFKAMPNKQHQKKMIHGMGYGNQV